MNASVTNGKKKSFGGQALHDMADYIDSVEPQFEFVGSGDIEQISSILGQNSCNNIIYTGKSGVGRSANIQGIVRKKKDAQANLATAGECGLPLHMIGKRFMLLDVNTLFDMDDPEKIVQDAKKIFVEMAKPGDHVLVIEDANGFLEAIKDHQVPGLVSAFMRELKKGTFQTVWMVRDEAGKNKLADVLSCHSDVSDLFTVLTCEPPPKDEVLKIMQATRKSLEAHYEGLTIPDAVDQEIVDLTYTYPNLPIYRHEQPARALRLRDQIASNYVTRAQTRPVELDRLEKEMKELTASGQPDGAKIAEVQGQIDSTKARWNERASQLYYVYGMRREIEGKIDKCEAALEQEMTELKSQIKAETKAEPSEWDIGQRKTPQIKQHEQELRDLRRDLEEKVIPAAQKIRGQAAQVLELDAGEAMRQFAELSGIPNPDENEDEKALNLAPRIKEKVFGQDHAAEAIGGAVKRARAGLKAPHQPIGSFLMLGSSGIGKSFIAKCTAGAMFDDESALVRFDMSEYMEKHSVSRLIGAPPGYAGYGNGGMLTNAVRSKPYCVILFDEIEKAHPDVFKILLQVLDDGRLTDELGTVDFRNVMVCMTTNLAQELSLDDGVDPESDETRESVIAAMRKIFPQELINRVDEFLLLKALSPEIIRKIVARDVAEVNKTLKGRNMSVELSGEDIATIVEDRYKLEEGARQVQKFVANKMVKPLADIVLRNKQHAEGGVIKAIYMPDNNGFALDFMPGKTQAPSPEAAASALQTAMIRAAAPQPA